MAGFRKERFTGPLGDGSASFDVYRRGEGPPILLMQEAPGIGREALAFCDRLVRAGFEVWLPHWFGPLGRTSRVGNVVRILCMRREFDVFARDRSSPIVDWMRALCRHAATATGHARVGVIGMCLSGNFALTLIAEPNVWAAVASQPSLPAGANEDALHMAPSEVAAVRAAIDAKGPARAWRFRDDKICTAARFAALDRAFNDDRVRVIAKVIDGPGHGVFTLDYDDAPGSPTEAALAEAVGYFRERLVT